MRLFSFAAILFLVSFLASFFVAAPALAVGEKCCTGFQIIGPIGETTILDPFSGKCASLTKIVNLWPAGGSTYEQTCRTNPANPFCGAISAAISSAVVPSIENGCKTDKQEACDVPSGTCKNIGDAVRAISAPTCQAGMVPFNSTLPGGILISPATIAQARFCPELENICCRRTSVPLLSNVLDQFNINPCVGFQAIPGPVELLQILSGQNYCTILKNKLTDTAPRNVCNPPANLDTTGGANRCVVASFLSLNPYDINCADANGNKDKNLIQTAIGCVPIGQLTGKDGFLSFALRWVFGFAGGVILLMLIFTGYSLMTSQGNPEKLQAAKENLVSIFSGLILIVFSLVLLQTIGAGILNLPTFK